jgi:hypothetical protein
MRKTDHLTKEQLRESLLKMPPETIKEFQEMDRADSWLLALNFPEMDRRESDPNYDPADDPTCVSVTIENDKK